MQSHRAWIKNWKERQERANIIWWVNQLDRAPQWAHLFSQRSAISLEMCYGTMEFLDGPRYPSHLFRVTPRNITSLALLCFVAQPFQSSYVWHGPERKQNSCLFCQLALHMGASSSVVAAATQKTAMAFWQLEWHKQMEKLLWPKVIQ